MAPLHNPPAINCIEACKKIFSHHPLQVAVFDTAFYKNLLPKVYTYPIPMEYFQKYGIRKIGFHGISHKFVTQEILKKSNKNKKIIICHLGNGCSVTCVKDGVAYDTSLGFGSYSGLLMGTRCGDMDPAIIFYIMRNEKLSVDEMENILIGKSGLFGISGGYSDNRELTDMAMRGHQEATLALQVQAYQVKKYIGSFVAAMGGIDVLVFTAGMGQYSSELRQEICDGLDYMGIVLNPDLNKEFNGKQALISSERSKAQIWILPTNEELLIAQDTYKIVNEQKM
jgi:acetate kinase